MRILYWTVTIVVALLLADFAYWNNEPVSVSLWPLPIELSTRLYLIVLLAMLVGFLFGELVAWLGGRRWRRDARAKARRVEALERELAATQAQLRPAAPGTRLAVTGAPRD